MLIFYTVVLTCSKFVYMCYIFEENKYTSVTFLKKNKYAMVKKVNIKNKLHIYFSRKN